MNIFEGIEKQKYRKEDLVAKIQENMENHKKEFEESSKIYLKAVSNVCKKMLDKVEKGELVNFEKELREIQKPRSYLDHYERALAMFNMSVNETIELDQKAFSQLILDQWDWKSMFTSITMSNSNYLG